MPYKNIEDVRASNKRSYEKNKEKWKPTRKKWDEENKEKHLGYGKKYRENNREKTRMSTKTWQQSERGRKATRLWRLNNPEKQKLSKRKNLLKQYGLTLESYQDLLDKQNNACAICKRKILLCIDHNHKTGKTRGLLCHACNRAIGMLQENVDILQNAINYVKTFQT